MKKLISRGSGASLNLFRYAAMVAVLLMLGIGNAWAGGGSSNYYASLQINQSGPTGAGAVYVANSNTKPGSANAGTAVKSAATTTKSGNVTMYWWVDINPGYNVTLSGKVTGGPYSAASANGNVSCAASGTANGTQAYTATATFVAVTVDKVNNSTSNTSLALDPTDASADYPFTVTFATSNLKTIALDLNKSPETADGKFSITSWALDGTNVVASGKFNGGGSYGGASRNHSTTVSLQSKASGSTAKTCTITANFPALAFVDADVTDVYTTQSDATKTGSTVFNFNYGAEDDFPTTPTFTHTSGSGAFAVTGYEVEPDFSKGTCKVTVDYSFNPNGAVGTTKEELKITSVGGTVYSATVTGEAEAEATDDASVTTVAGVTTNYATFAAALAAANASSGCTLTLLRNVDLGTITATNNITKAMTIDLNGKTLKAAVNATSVGILTITQAVAVTIKDSKTGGKIINEVDRNSEVRTIFVNKAGATLTLESGTLAVNNLRQYASAANASLGVTAASTSCSSRVIHQVAGSTVNINGGRLEAYGTRSVYGIVQGSSAATNKAGTTVLNITDGEIYSEGPYNIFGVYAYGKVNLSGGTINVHVNTNMIDARYAADNANNTYNGYAYGIYLKESVSATATSCYAGILNMAGGTINVTNDRTLSVDRRSYGVLFNAASAVVDAGKTGADGTLTQKASATGSITGGEINVTSGTQYSYGVYVLGNYNSYDNTYHAVQVKNCKITAKAYVYAYGVYANAGFNGTNNGCYAGDVELTNCDVYAESLNTSTAAAVWVNATGGTLFKDDSNATKARCYGEYAVAGKAVINNGKYEAKTKTTSAYAVGTASRYKTTYDAETTVAANRKLGGNAEAYPTLIIHGGTFKATTSGTNTTARAVSNGGYCTIDGGEFEAYAGGTTADGIYTVSGKLKASGAKITVSATGTAYGVRVDAANVPYNTNAAWTGFNYAGDAELNNLDVTVTTRTADKAHGVYVNAAAYQYTQSAFDTYMQGQVDAGKTTQANYDIWAAVFPGNSSYAIAGKAVINGGKYTVSAATTTAYGVWTKEEQVAADTKAHAAPEVSINNAKFIVTTNGTTTAYGVYSGGDITIDGCDFTVQPKTTTAYGVYQYSNKATITNTKFDVKGTGTVYGLYANAAISGTHGWDYHGEFELGEGNDMTVAATGGNTSHVLTLIASKKNINVEGGSFNGDYANAASAHITGGSYKATATGTTSYVLNLSAEQVQNAVKAAPSCTIEGGKFWALASGGTTGICTTNGVNGNILFKGGVYNVNTTLSKHIPEGYEEFPLPDERPEYTAGYRYAIEEAGNHGIYVCQIGSTKYKSLEEALQVVGNNQVIYMIANYTMTTPGDYILPSGATLLIPYTTGSGAGATTAIGNSAKTTTSATAPTLFRKLTFGPGVNLTCSGTIETSAEQKANGQYGANVGMASGAYGQIHMEEGSHISIENGARLNCWGFITGKGTIEVKNGGKILEGFQMGDWCGGTNYSNVFSSASNANYVFPITHYFYQSIECPITYRPGSRAYGSTHIAVSSLFGTSVVGQDDVPLVGTSGSMFIMDDNDVSKETWVMKNYDEETDQCIWTINSGASIGNLTISISGYNMKSASYDLPITTNMSIVLNYGEMAIGQNTVMLPGSKLIVNKQGTAVIDGVTVVAYDAEDWAGSSRYFATYSPTWGTSSPRKNIPVTDAEVFLHGKVNIKGNGGLYTTPSGANIHSTNADAGEVIYTTAATGNKTSYYLNQGGTTRPSLTVNPAKLKNGDGSFASSAGTAAGKTWTYKNDVWDAWSKDGCFFMNAQDKPHAKPAALVELTSKTPDANHLHHDAATGARNFVWDENCYWWEVVTTPTPEGYYQSLNADNNGKYNYYYYDSAAACWKIKTITVTWSINGSNTNYTVGYGTKPHWLGATPTKTSSSSDYDWRWDGWTVGSDATVYGNEELPVVTANTTFTAHFYEKYYQSLVTFKNSDGTILESKLWNRGSIPSYEGTPTKEATASQTFEFNGTWSPAITAVGSSSVEYVAQYTATTRQYNVEFVNYDMSVLGTTKVNYNATPTTATYKAAIAPSDFEPYKPDNNAYSFNFSGWRLNGASSNGFVQVKGDQTYVAQFAETTKKYRISFVDEDGETVLHWTQLEFDAMPSYDGPATSGFNKQDAEWTYVFTGWNPATFSQVKGPQTYVANYNKTKRKYDITWVDGNGATLKTDQVAYGSTPSYSGATPTKTSTSTHSYVFNNTWSPAIVAVVGEATYTAQFNETERKYRVTWDAATNGGTCATEYSDFSYNAAIGTLPVATKEGHTFNGWFTSATGGMKITTATKVTEDVAYHAQFTINKYDITWVDGNGATLKTEQVEYGQTPAYTGETPTKTATDQYTYTFNNTWSPAIVAVTEDATYTAQFGSTVNKYTITWVDGNGETLKTEQVEYGQTPTYTGETPTKTATDQYTYTFNNTWSPAIVSVTGAATYTAQFGSTVNKYEITWVDGNGETLKTEQVEYGQTPAYTGATPTKTATDQYTYSFNNTWSPAIVAVTGAATYTAQFGSTVNKYDITWVDGNGATLKTEQVEYGQTPAYIGETPTKTATTQYTYTFNNTWLPAIVAVTGAATYTAQFGSTINQYNLNVAANNAEWGTVSGGGLYDYNTAHTITASPNPGFKFVKWNDDNTNASRVVTVTADVTFTATFDVDVATYTVKHWQQNITDNNYTEYESETLSGTIGETTNAVAKSYTGFTAQQPISQQTIALENTVVDIYYDRITYTISWIVKLSGEIVDSKEETLRYGATPSFGPDPTKEQDDRYEYSFSSWTPTIAEVTENRTYEGTFEAVARTYDVTWNNADGTLIEKEENEYTWGAQPSFKGSTPEYSDATGNIYVFRGWKYGRTGVEYAKDATLPELAGNETYTAAYDIQRILDVPAEHTISVNTTVDITTVHVAGKLNVVSGSLTTGDLILEGSESASGEVIGDVTATNAYFDLSHAGGFKAKTWYAVAVPWQVSVPAYDKEHNGVYIINGGSDPVRQELGRSFDLIYYDGSERANHGHSDACWKFVEDDASDDHIMKPGRAYMIYLTSDADVIRFERKEGTVLQTTTLAVSTYTGNGNVKDANWNGIANPATYHAYINAHADAYHETENAGQIYDAENKQYNVVNLSSQNLVVGQPVFIQATETNESVGAYASHDEAFHAAPRRAKATTTPLTRCEILFAASGTEESDRIIVRADEDKEVNEYTVGQDLVKMGVSNLVPQMWIERYDAKLCINTLAPINDATVYPLGIFAPQAGEYTISVNEQTANDFMLYLTIDGRSVWNLTYAPYTATLEQGTTNRYGLKLVRNSNAPAVTTGIQDAQADAAAQKIVLDGQVYILRGNNVYSVDGQLVK